jgi:molybdate transport system substrate-binding protein
MIRYLLAILAVSMSVFGCSRGANTTLQATAPAGESISFFVAASTKDAVDKIAQDFNKSTGIKVEVTPGPSSGLVKQIEQGAKADLFLSADQPWADHLAKQDLVAKRRTLLLNKMVVVVPSDSTVQIKQLKDLAEPAVKRLALAEEKVPAGTYAREALAKAKIWDQLKDRVVGGIDVRATLQLVEGGADAGMVYNTDAVGSTKVRVALEVEPSLHKPIEYPLVVLRRPEGIKHAAERFYEFLQSEQAAAIFRQAKFELAPVVN